MSMESYYYHYHYYIQLMSTFISVLIVIKILILRLNETHTYSSVTVLKPFKSKTTSFVYIMSINCLPSTFQRQTYVFIVL